MTMTDIKTETTVKPRIDPDLSVKEPPLFKVIYINDETTTVEFVIESLRSVFDYTEDDAEEITINIHKDGSAVVAVLPFEIAEQKGIEVTLLARNNGFPLQVKLEAES
jgi:ATP-dependent Clp protease adaptor protein ClpS